VTYLAVSWRHPVQIAVVDISPSFPVSSLFSLFSLSHVSAVVGCEGGLRGGRGQAWRLHLSLVLQANLPLSRAVHPVRESESERERESERVRVRERKEREKREKGERKRKRERETERGRERRNRDRGKDEIRLTFQISSCPVRYERRGEPLSVTSKAPITSDGIAPCPHCQSPRVFELQLMPALVNHLAPVHDTDPPVEFSTVCVYTCGNDRCCLPTAGEEAVLFQPDPDAIPLELLS
jgi:hypothetical protein